MTLEELEILVDGCKHGHRLSQKRLYNHFYSMGMSVCVRYAESKQEAEEICQDAFVKAFANIKDCKSVGALPGWLRTIFIRASIDYYRKYQRKKIRLDRIEVAFEKPVEPTVIDDLSLEEKLGYIQALPLACRLTFNLYAVEGYSTPEVAKLLGCSQGTVRANLVRARQRLQIMIAASNSENAK